MQRSRASACARSTRPGCAWTRRQPDDDRRRLDARARGIGLRGPVRARRGTAAASTRASASAWCEDARRRHLGRRQRLRHRRATWCARSCRAQARRRRERDALQERVGELAMQPLDPRGRCGSFHLVEDYDGGSALLVRIHHCIADGIALISVTMSLVDGGAPPPRAPRRQGAPDGAEDWIADTLIKPLTDCGEGARAGRRRRRASRWTCWRPAARRLGGAGPGAPAYQLVSDVARAGADAGRLEDAAEGQARRHQARGLVRADRRWTRSRRSARR